MKRINIILILAFLLAGFSSAQQPDYNLIKDAKLKEMKKLDPMLGNWSGTGWISMGPGTPERFTVNESIEKKVDGLALVVNGLGKDSTGTKTVHNALGVISWDTEKNHYLFDTYLADGRSTRATATFENGKLVWGFPVEGQGHIRYTLDFSVNAKWKESGEFSRDGVQWFKFMEMNLNKIQD